MKIKTLVLALVGGATVLSSMPASAQYYYDPYGRPPPRHRPPPPGYYQDGYPPPGYYRPPPRQRLGQACVTSRGVCGSRPAIVGSPCQCWFDGFGRKRGNIQ